MAYRRILTIQDISCVGQCSLTVALPILSACGHETCILPTAVLSTHTGGFGKPEVVHLNDSVTSFWHHWQRNEITFDAILVGYIGSVEGVRSVRKIADALLAPGGLLIVDPALADHGKVYSGLSEAYVQEMAKLCHSADIILPNVTEAALFSGSEYRGDLDESYVKHLLEKLDHPYVILTGVGYREGETGVVLWNGTEYRHYTHMKIGRNYHGTGDMFAAGFTGALMQELPAWEAVQLAADFVRKCIENTEEHSAHWYGVKFETAIPYLIQQLKL